MGLSFFMENFCEVDEIMTQDDIDNYAVKAHDPGCEWVLKSIDENASTVFTFNKGWLIFNVRRPNLQICHFYIAPRSKLGAAEVWKNTREMATEIGGIKYVTMNTQRDNKAWEKLVGFETIRTIHYMRYKI